MAEPETLKALHVDMTVKGKKLDEWLRDNIETNIKSEASSIYSYGSDHEMKEMQKALINTLAQPLARACANTVMQLLHELDH